MKDYFRSAVQITMIAVGVTVTAFSYHDLATAAGISIAPLLESIAGLLLLMAALDWRYRS